MLDRRAAEQELIDRADCDPALVAASYRFMENVNRFFGGARVVRHFLAAEACRRGGSSPLRVLDIGSGSCDIPLAMSRWARASGIQLDITCVENADSAVDIARLRLDRAADRDVRLLQEDVFAYRPDAPYDCAVASMCFHHFSDRRILELVRRLSAFVRGSLLINDLRRSVLALCGAALLLGACGAPAGVRHDALLSVRRGFRLAELGGLLRQLQGVRVCVTPQRWFRIAAVIDFNCGDSE